MPSARARRSETSERPPRNSGQTEKGAKDLSAKRKQVVDQSNQKVAGSEAKQQQILAQQAAAQADLMEGKAFIQQGIQLSNKKRAEKEAERAKAQAGYLAAKKRLLAWALMHEKLRWGEQANLDASMNEAEQMLLGRAVTRLLHRNECVQRRATLYTGGES